MKWAYLTLTRSVVQNLLKGRLHAIQVLIKMILVFYKMRISRVANSNRQRSIIVLNSWMNYLAKWKENIKQSNLQRYDKVTSKLASSLSYVTCQRG